MEFVLMIVTGVSLALAVGMSVVGWLLLREGRQRSAARVEALQSLAMDEGVDAVEEPAVFAAEAPAPMAYEGESWDISREAEPAPAVDALIVERPALPRAAARPAPRRVAQPAPAALPLMAVSDEMFGGAVEERGAPARRWLVLAAVIMLMAATGGAVYLIERPATLRAATPGQAAAPARAGAAPLELLSLTQVTEADGTFTVTGLVHNPTQGSAAGTLTAVVYLFDAGGNYFASGRSSLEVATLQPGDESPFVVRVPGAARVGRYRVGFRQGDGGVVAHVDRRGQALEGTTEVAGPPRAPTSHSKSVPGA